MTSHDLELTALSRHVQGLAQLAGDLLRDRHAGEDAAQEAALRALKAKRVPRAADEQPRWLRSITRRITIDRWKSASVRADHEAAWARERRGAAPSSEEIAERAELAALLHQVVKELPGDLSSVLTDHYLGGLSVPEIAARDGVSVNTVRDRLRRGKAELRRRLERRGIDGEEQWWTALAPLASLGLRTPAAPPAAMGGSALALLALAGVAVVAGLALLVRESRATPSQQFADPDLAGVEVTARSNPADRRAASEESLSAPSRESALAAPAGSASIATPCTGLVQDTSGRPLSGVRVKVEGTLWKDGERTDLPVVHGTTDDEGRYAFDVPFVPGASRSIQFTPGEFHVTHEERLGKQSEPAPLALAPVVLTRAGSASGRVVDSSGAGLPGVVVRFAPWPEGGSYGLLASTETTSNGDGSFLLANVPRGTYDVWLVRDGYTTGRCRDVRFTLGSRGDLGETELRWAETIEGVIVDQNGQPVAGVEISASPVEEPNIDTACESGPDGRFSMALRWTGQHRLELEGPTIEPVGTVGESRLLVTPGDEPLRLTVSSVEMTSFLLVDAVTGAPVESAGVRVKRNSGSKAAKRVYRSGGPARPRKCPGGVVERPARPGVDLVRIDAPGYLPHEGDVTHDEGTDSTSTIPLRRAASAEGVVLHRGRPVLDLEVTLRAPGGSSARGSDPPRTDAEGRYVVEGLRGGRHVVAVRSELLGLEGTASFAVPEGRLWSAEEPPRVEIDALVLDTPIEVPATGTIRGRVLLPGGLEPEGFYAFHGDWGEADLVPLDPEGRFELHGVECGERKVSLGSRPGLIEDIASESVSVEKDRVIEVVIDASSFGTCSLVLEFDIAGVAPEEISVIVRAEEARRGPWIYEHLDEHGRLELTERASGRAHIELDINERASMTLLDHALELEPGRRLHKTIQFTPGALEIALRREDLERVDGTIQVGLFLTGHEKRMAHANFVQGEPAPNHRASSLRDNVAVLPLVYPGELRVVVTSTKDRRQIFKAEANVTVEPGGTARVAMPPMEPRGGRSTPR